MDALVAELAPEFGEARLFRPYRDTRFSRDKSPYKTTIAAMIGDGYVQLSANGLMAGAGMYHLAPDQLARYRAAVDAEVPGRRLQSIVDSLRAAQFEVTAMETLKTTPRGYPKDHPRVELPAPEGPRGHEGMAGGVVAGHARCEEASGGRAPLLGAAPAVAPRPRRARGGRRRRTRAGASGPDPAADVGRASWARLRGVAGHRQRPVGVPVDEHLGSAGGIGTGHPREVEERDEVVGSRDGERVVGVRGQARARRPGRRGRPRAPPRRSVGPSRSRRPGAPNRARPGCARRCRWPRSAPRARATAPAAPRCRGGSRAAGGR